MKNCPYCAEEIQEEAIICKHCGRYLSNKTPEEVAQKRDQLTHVLAEYEKNLEGWERYLYEWEQLASQIERKVTLAYVWLLVGFLFIPACGGGLIIMIIAALELSGQTSKRDNAESKKKMARSKIEEGKSKIIDIKAKLVGL